MFCIGVCLKRDTRNSNHVQIISYLQYHETTEELLEKMTLSEGDPTYQNHSLALIIDFTIGRTQQRQQQNGQNKLCDVQQLGFMADPVD